MKIRLFLIGLLSLSAVSCSLDEIVQIESASVPADDDCEFYATLEKQPATETKVYADENLKVLWNADDRITIFNKNAYNQQYRFTGEDGDNAGGFNRVPSEGGSTASNPLDRVYAVYPYRESTKISNDGIITTAIPSDQTYKKDSFGIGSNTMVATAESNRLMFKNVGGYLSLKFYGEGVSVSSITLKSNNGELIAGECEVDMSSGLPESSMVTSKAVDEIIMTCDTPVRLGATADDAVQFIFVLPPLTLSKGFTVVVMTPDGSVFEMSSSRVRVIGRSSITPLTALRVVPNVPENQEFIEFADPAVKAICLERWNTNGDNELSYDEVAAVTDLGEAFYKNTSIESFDELAFFTGLTEIGKNAFYGCSNLTSVEIPDNVTKIGDVAFCRSGIVTLSISSRINVIGARAFDSCSSLENIEVDENNTVYDSRNGCNAIIVTESNTLIQGCNNSVIPNGVTGIGDYAFSGCIRLASIIIPESVTSIGLSVFNQCESLEEIVIPISVTKIGASSFTNCNNLAKMMVEPGNPVYDSREECNAIIETESDKIIAACRNTKIPNSVKIIGHTAFSDNTYLESIEIPEGVTLIEQTAFTGCKSMVSVILPSTNEELGVLALSYCPLLSSITIKAETPPALPGFVPLWPFNMISNDYCIYVPSGSVDLYKEAWERLADHIQAISTE